MLVLLVEVSAGVPGCPVALGVIAGWDGTVALERALLAVEKSAEVVVRAGLAVLLAGDGARWLKTFADEFVAYISHSEAAISALTRT